jgi:hypothetical protein
MLPEKGDAAAGIRIMNKRKLVWRGTKKMAVYRRVKNTDVFFDYDTMVRDKTTACGFCIGETGITKIGYNYTRDILISALQTLDSDCIDIVLVEGGMLLFVDHTLREKGVLVAPRVETDPTPVWVEVDKNKIAVLKDLNPSELEFFLSRVEE